jgi:hypothetical protein
MRNDPFPVPSNEDPHENMRRQIQEHPNFRAWYQSLGEETRQAFDMLYLMDVTPELIQFAQQVPEAEWWQSVFLRVISGGNPDRYARTVLTQHALLTVLADMEALGRRGQPRIT